MEADKVAHVLELEERLAKIRLQLNSKLENQKYIAIILSAVEENIKSSEANDTAKNIVSYIIAFMSLLDEAVDRESGEILDLQLATSACYLLDIIFQYTPKTLLRSKFTEILTKVAPCITDENSEAPLIRAAIGCLESLLIAQDAQAWNNTEGMSVTPKRGLQGLLELSLDPRPKVRKRAQDSVHAILANPPAAPTAEHVASVTIATFTLKTLEDALNEVATVSNKKLKTQNGPDELNNRIIRVLRLITAVISTGQWPSPLTEHICNMLLEVTKSSDQYLVSSAFECFEKLFNVMAESTVTLGLAESKSLKVLDIIFSLTPSNSDMNLVGSWIAVVVKGMSAYAAHEPFQCLSKIPEVFRLMSQYLSSETPEIYYSASQCLIAILTDSVKDEVLLYPPAVNETFFESVDEIISKISELLVEFLSVRYSHCAKEVLNILAAAINKFRYRANPDFLKPLEIVGEWRTHEDNFLEFRTEAENVIGAAISAIGPDAVLGCLPLNLESPSDNMPGRAWLLPLMRDYTRNTTLSTFTRQLVPLIQFFESRSLNLPKESVQLKIFETVVDQIWSTLPHFCELPTDLRVSFTDEFAAELSSLLYSKVELRTTLCHALKVLVESNSSYVSGASAANDILLHQHFSVSNSQDALEYLGTKAANLLAVLFNVFTQTAPNARGYILETIEAYLKITSQKDLEKTFNNVCGLLKNAMDQEAQKSVKGKPQLSATLLDLVVCMAKYVPKSSYPALFSIFDATVSSADALTQKRAYRIITKLSELDAGLEALSTYCADIENTIVQNADAVQTSSKSARLAAIKTIVQILAPDDLNFIIRVVAEVILCTKDVNEKSREMSFDTLICMGKKMNAPNGMIRLSQIPGYDEQTPDQKSTISEFFKIIAAGLIGESQHMVSSTITAFACLVFEFKDEIESSVLLDIYDTIELYLTSNSREIAKSAIGFTKVCVLGLSDELMRPKVPELLLKLLRWSHEHTGHFKAKVKHIIERLIRRFGYDFIEANFPEEDLKLLSNIRKTRNRSKRKETEVDVSSPVASTKGSRFMNAFDEAIYESSDNEDAVFDEESKNKKSKAKQFIVESKENPLDLLDSQTLAHISSSRPKKFTKDQKNKRLQDEMFNFDSDGKLIIKGQKKINDEEDPLKSVTNGINAYLEAVKHGPIRGQKNKLKFKKGTRAGEDASDGEDESESKVPRRTFTNKNRIGKSGKRGPKFKSRRKL